MIDPNLAAVYALRGHYPYVVKADKLNSIKDLEKAQQLDPNYIDSYQYLVELSLYCRTIWKKTHCSRILKMSKSFNDW